MKSFSLLVFLFIYLNNANAALISIENEPSNLVVGDVFSLDIGGTEFTMTPDGGGINLFYDQDVLNVLSVSIDETIWDFEVGISTGVIDNSTGSVSGIMVNAWSDVGDAFIIANVEFQAVGAGAADLVMSEYLTNPWASGGMLINPDFAQSTVTINEAVIPVPPALILFASGVVGLFGFVRLQIKNS